MSHSEGERGFHVCYQLLTGASSAQRESWALRPVGDHAATAARGPLPESGCTEGLPSDFKQLCAAMTTLTVHPEQQEALFALVGMDR